MSNSEPHSPSFDGLDSREHLIFLITSEYGLSHGRDFWCGAQVDPATGSQISAPFLVGEPWPADRDFPDQKTVDALRAKHAAAWAARRVELDAQEVRSGWLGDIRARVDREIGDAESRLGRLSTLISALLPLTLVEIAHLDPDDSRDAARLKIYEAVMGCDPGELQAMARRQLQKIRSRRVVPMATLDGVDAVITEALADNTRAAQILTDARRRRPDSKQS